MGLIDRFPVGVSEDKKLKTATGKSMSPINVSGLDFKPIAIYFWGSSNVDLYRTGCLMFNEDETFVNNVYDYVNPNGSFTDVSVFDGGFTAATDDIVVTYTWYAIGY